MKRFLIFLTFGLTGCATTVDNSAYWNNVGSNKNLLCKSKEIAAQMVQFGYTERSTVGQALKIRNMHRIDKCFIVDKSEILRTGNIFIFPLVNEFPESFRGVKQQVEEVEFENNNYWLIKTK